MRALISFTPASRRQRCNYRHITPAVGRAQWPERRRSEGYWASLHCDVRPGMGPGSPDFFPALPAMSSGPIPLASVAGGQFGGDVAHPVIAPFPSVASTTVDHESGANAAGDIRVGEFPSQLVRGFPPCAVPRHDEVWRDGFECGDGWGNDRFKDAAGEMQAAE